MLKLATKKYKIMQKMNVLSMFDELNAIDHKQINLFQHWWSVCYIIQKLLVLELIYNNFQMRSPKPTKYAKISLKKRVKLVELVIQKNKSLSKAAKALAIKLSTAKMIVKRFKDQGSYFQPKATQPSQRQQNQPQDQEQNQQTFQRNNWQLSKDNVEQADNHVNYRNQVSLNILQHQSMVLYPHHEYVLWVPFFNFSNTI